MLLTLLMTKNINILIEDSLHLKLKKQALDKEITLKEHIINKLGK